jgi:hypothetical protein
MRIAIKNISNQLLSGTSASNVMSGIAAFFLGAAIVCALSGPAAAASLHDTGQTKCYQTDVPWAEIPCYGTGQDGEYTSAPLSYTADSLTVTDNNTGLMWQRQNDNVQPSWIQANTYCGSLNLGGQTGWRLPSNQELMSIADYSRGDPLPALNTAYFLFSAGQSQLSYWTSTAVSGDSGSAWYVYFSNGGNSNDVKSANYYVRCVRGTPISYGNYVNNGDNTVTDHATGLLWQRVEDTTTRPWGESINACKTLGLAGRGWRLPNIRELTSLVDYSRDHPAMNTTIFSYINAQSYWSSTTGTDVSSNAWIAYILDGKVFSDPKTNNYWTKCVTCAELPVKKAGTTSYYLAIGAGYTASGTGDTLQIQSQSFPGDLLLHDGGAIALKGGYNCDYSSNHGFSTIGGKVTIGKSTVITVENIIIR